MSGSARLIFTLLAAVFAIYIVWHVAAYLVAKLIAILIPLLLIGGVVAVLVLIVNRKALNGGRRILP